MFAIFRIPTGKSNDTTESFSFYFFIPRNADAEGYLPESIKVCRSGKGQIILNTYSAFIHL
ncbi:hypothetical protein BZZ01_03895 [Nostocales cyanobacterium HT-58-2]|nr:hypothetical protein BZZ01_03895 [Nostocales cyanobacterium HT-58-2]